MPKNQEHPVSYIGNLRRNLRSDCENCFGLCCVSLYFSASEGFPVDKEAGRPCPNLQEDFCCCVHSGLAELGLKGCLAFDCFGAGQRVSQVSFGGQDWRKVPESAKEMFEVFLIMRQLHELLWYLAEALALQPARPIHAAIRSMFDETERLTHFEPGSLLKLDVAAHRAQVNILLLKTSELVQAEARGEIKAPSRSQNTSSRSPNTSSRSQIASSKRQKILGRGLDLMGADLRKVDLRGENLRGAYLIAAALRGVDLSGADLIGADLRDTDLRGADLTNSIFLTQAQINSAKGDAGTKLPPLLFRPIHWEQ